MFVCIIIVVMILFFKQDIPVQHILQDELQETSTATSIDVKGLSVKIFETETFEEKHFRPIYSDEGVKQQQWPRGPHKAAFLSTVTRHDTDNVFTSVTSRPPPTATDTVHCCTGFVATRIVDGSLLPKCLHHFEEN